MSGSPKLKLVSTKPAAPSREELIDEYGELKEKEAAFQPTAQRLKLLREMIAGWISPDHPADQPVSFSGRKFDALASPAQNQRKVSRMAQLMKFLGKIRFFKVCKIGVEALEEELGEAEAGKWFDQERTGPRKITAARRVATVTPEAA